MTGRAIPRTAAMHPVGYYLREYATDHRHPVSKLLHRVCVPAIVVSLLGLLWSIPVPAPVARLGAYINWGTAAVVVVMAFYVFLSPSLAVGMLAFFALSMLVVAWLATLPWPLWQTSLAIFAIAWLGQFVGHFAEGKRPSFFRDLRFLLIGPLWILADIYRRLGIGAPPNAPED